jgi:hypothetical protein
MLGAVALGASILVAWFLLRGSRVAWVIAVFSAAAQLAAPVAMSQPVWFGVAGAILLACLLVPTSGPLCPAFRVMMTDDAKFALGF